MKKEKQNRSRRIGAMVAASLSTVAALSACQENPFRREEHKSFVEPEEKPERDISGSCGGRWEGGCGTRMERRRGGRMKGMMMGGRIQHGIDPAQLPDRDSEGSRLLIKYCTQCHGLPDPGRHSAAEWPPAVARMIQQMRWTNDKGICLTG
jgi:hypothetical protein